MTTVGAVNVSGKPVVVGVDGSASDRTALEFAIDEAVMRRSSLRVIAAMQLPDYGLAPLTMFEPPSPEKLVDDVLMAAQSRVDELVAAYGEGAGDVSIAVEAEAGHPGDVLCAAADGAELLVLGHRGRGATATRLIGSVGLHCVLHANCPVTVVRPDA
jgi:nucleotide-binding universal stress UspA family protein